jgi:hypothetical protein
LHLTNSSQLNLELRIIIAAMVEGRRHASLSKRRVLNDDDANCRRQAAPPASLRHGGSSRTVFSILPKRWLKLMLRSMAMIRNRSQAGFPEQFRSSGRSG